MHFLAFLFAYQYLFCCSELLVSVCAVATRNKVEPTFASMPSQLPTPF